MSPNDKPSDSKLDGGVKAFVDGVKRRDILAGSATALAVSGMAGCTQQIGGSPTAGGDSDTNQNPQNSESPSAHGCPTVEGIEDGLIWVLKKASGPWTGSISGVGSEEFSSGEGIKTDLEGMANIGQGRIQFQEAGEYTFLYRIDSTGLTWVEKPETLIAVLFRDDPYVQNGIVTTEDILAYSAYDYYSGSPLSMSFRIPNPGTYRIAYGPADGAFLFEEWLPDLSERDNHLRLGVGIKESTNAYRWLLPEAPEHVLVWFGDEEAVISREANPPDVTCEFDRSDFV